LTRLEILKAIWFLYLPISCSGKFIESTGGQNFRFCARTAHRPETLPGHAARAKLEIKTHFDSKQQAFLDFVLAQYVTVGVHELDQQKLSPLLKLKYNNAISDAMAELGQPEQIRTVFVGFQKYLYQQTVT
jgi:type I restriction enzyme R subunit